MQGFRPAICQHRSKQHTPLVQTGVPFPLGVCHFKLSINGFGFGRQRAAVAQVSDDFQNFAAGRKHPAMLAFVCVHGLHELDFVTRVISFASGGVDLTPALRFGSLFLLRDGGSNIGLVGIR